MLNLTTYLLTRLCMASLALAAQEAGSPTARAKFWSDRAGAHLAVCVAVGERAQVEGLDPLEVIAVSFTESRHTRGLTSHRGAVGPLQALKRYWARAGDKDNITPGLRAWRYYRSRSRSTREAAGRYNGAGARSAYAAQVAAHRDHLARILRHYTHTGAAPR
jgi:hypothetical protein